MADLETIYDEMFDFFTLAKMVYRLRDDRMAEDCHKKSKEHDLFFLHISGPSRYDLYRTNSGQYKEK